LSARGRYAAAYARLPRNARGALWMLASAISFTVMTMLIRCFATTRPGILLFRSGAGTIGMILAFHAYQKLRARRRRMAGRGPRWRRSTTRAWCSP
jgi:hypothetical protein